MSDQSLKSLNQNGKDAKSDKAPKNTLIDQKWNLQDEIESFSSHKLDHSFEYKFEHKYTSSVLEVNQYSYRRKNSSLENIDK